MTILYLDTETYSEVNLITQGVYRYAGNCEIIMWQYAIDDGDVIVSNGLTDGLKQLLSDPSHEVVIHNSSFDRAVINHRAGIEIPFNRIFDTMACAMAHSLPGSLGKLCEIMRIDTDKSKDKEGSRLINLFCKPQKTKDGTLSRNTCETHPAEWQAFEEYGRRDITAMREIYKSLPRWNFKDKERRVWELDQKINNRGVCVDLDLCNAAIRASARAKKEYDADTLDKTNGIVTTTARRDLFLDYLRREYKVEVDDMTSATVKRLLDENNLPQPVLDLLDIRLQANKNSAAKYKVVTNAVSADGRLRGLLQYCGASRTGRWSGRLFQPQNLARSSIKNKQLEQEIEALKHNAEDLI